MQYVGIYDKGIQTAEQIKKMSFWSVRGDVKLLDAIHNENEINAYLNEKRPNIFIVVMEQNDGSALEWLKQITNVFMEVKIIMVGYDKSYETVRELFVNGAFDYLIQPIESEQLEKAFARAYDTTRMSYILNELQMKVDALIDNIFLGGDQEEIIIRNIINQIYEDWNQDAINCQTITDKAKNYIYELLIDRKPWLEKFLYRNDFTYKFGFSLIKKEDIIQDWIKCFGEAIKMVRKYQIIDDKLVYRIGKYVIIHVDERLSLGSVAEGVYLNPSYVSNIFKKITGITFTNYMTEVKIDRAKVLLRDNKKKLYDIASIIGYSDSEYFAKIFKRKTGYSPSEYRRMLEET